MFGWLVDEEEREAGFQKSKHGELRSKVLRTLYLAAQGDKICWGAVTLSREGCPRQLVLQETVIVACVLQ